MNNDHPYTTLNSKIVYKNPWIQVREDKILHPEGSEGIYGFVESSDSVMVVVVNDKKEVYLVYAYRYPSHTWSWELPGGGSDGEDAVTASKRELLEETGILAKDWTILGKTYVCNGLMTERLITCLAQDITMTDQKDKNDEAIVSHGQFYSLEAVHAMVEEGKIDDGQTITGLYLAEQWLSR